MTALPMFDLAPAASLEAAAEKEAALLAALESLGSAIVAFSGGVDSTYLAWAAARALGPAALAVTAISASVAERSREEARALAQLIGIRHEVIASRETEDPRYLANNSDRCYWCKSELYTRLAALAAERGIAAVLDGTNRDDLGDWRPGRKAAAERSVRSPLVEAGMAKSDVRALSRRAGLPTWSQPASPCLSSRIPYGSPVTAAKLQAIDLAEEAVKALGFRELRVRHHGSVARVELAAAELPRALEEKMRRRIVAGVAAAGFDSVTIDPEPFRSGRLNEAVHPRLPALEGSPT